MTIRGAEAYIPPIGAPFRSLRLDGAPLKLLTGSVKMPPIVFGSMSFDDALRDLAGGKWGFRAPGCLTSKSEERETWTAGSLRTAVAWRSNSSRCMQSEETSDGLRFYKGTLLVILTSDQRCGPRQNVKFCASEKTSQALNFSSNLRV